MDGCRLATSPTSSPTVPRPCCGGHTCNRCLTVQGAALGGNQTHGEQWCRRWPSLLCWLDVVGQQCDTEGQAFHLTPAGSLARHKRSSVSHRSRGIQGETETRGWCLRKEDRTHTCSDHGLLTVPLHAEPVQGVPAGFKGETTSLLYGDRRIHLWDGSHPLQCLWSAARSLRDNNRRGGPGTR